MNELITQLEQYMERTLSLDEIKIASEAYLQGQRDCNADFQKVLEGSIPR
jgi:hypothetical protein